MRKALVAGVVVVLLSISGVVALETWARHRAYPDVRGPILGTGIEGAYRTLLDAGYRVEVSRTLPRNWDGWAQVADAPYIVGQYPDPSSGGVPPEGTTVELVMIPGLVSGSWSPPPKQCP